MPPTKRISQLAKPAEKDMVKQKKTKTITPITSILDDGDDDGFEIKPEPLRWLGLIDPVSTAAWERGEFAISTRRRDRNRETQRYRAEVVEPKKRAIIEKELDFQLRMVAGIHFRDYLETWNAAREAAKKRDFLSREEVDSEVLVVVGRVVGGAGLAQLTGESHAGWLGRMGALREQVARLWGMNRGRILAREPRYVEGLPGRMTLRPPRFMPHRRLEGTGWTPCMQCQVKGLRCPRTTWRPGGGESLNRLEACKRCVRSGEADTCLVLLRRPTERMRMMGDRGEWGFAGSGSDSGSGSGLGSGPGPGPGTERKAITAGRGKSLGAAATDAEKMAEESPDESAGRELLRELECQLFGFRTEIIGGRMQKVMVKGFAPQRKLDDE